MPQGPAESAGFEISERGWLCVPCPLLSRDRVVLASSGVTRDLLRGGARGQWRPEADGAAWVEVQAGVGPARVLLRLEAPPGHVLPAYRIESAVLERDGAGPWRPRLRGGGRPVGLPSDHSARVRPPRGPGGRPASRFPDPGSLGSMQADSSENRAIGRTRRPHQWLRRPAGPVVGNPGVRPRFARDQPTARSSSEPTRKVATSPYIAKTSRSQPGQSHRQPSMRIRAAMLRPCCWHCCSSSSPEWKG